MRTEVGVVGREGVGVKSGCKWVRREICSSDVPGKVSIRNNKVPQLPGGVSMTR